MPTKPQWLFAILASLLLVGFPLVVYLHSGDYVIAHDASMPATSAKAVEQLELLKQQNGGLLQGIIPPISFITALFYGVPLAFGLSATVTQISVMTATFAAALLLAIVGFDRLLLGGGRRATLGRRLDACLLGALYIVAPFTLVYISYGVFWSINVALAIGVMPLLFHLFLRCFVDERNEFQLASVAALTLCLIIVAWSILFVFPVILISIGLFLLRGGITRQDLAKIFVLGGLLFFGSLASLYGMYVSVFDARWQIAFDPVATNAAWAHIHGGILTGFLQYSAWTIYTSWTPRLLLGFPSHFFSAYYISLTFLLLVIVMATPLLITGHAAKRFLYPALMFLVAVFFVKGGDQPFGLVYKSMLSSVPGAGLIRTPDTKFGVFVILSIAIGFAFALANGDKALYKFRILCRLVILVVVAFHAGPLVNGQAILGVNSELAIDQSARGYAVTVTAAERQIIDVLLHDPASGVVMLPPTFSSTQREGGIFAYRSVVGEFVPNALYYSGWNEMPNEGVKEHLRLAVDEGAWQTLPRLGVGYVLVNRNTLGDRARQQALYHAVRNAPQAWVRVIGEGGYELYRLEEEFRKPLVAISTPSGESALQILDRRGWFTITSPSSLAESFAVTFRSAENGHWQLVVIPGKCVWHKYVCAAWGLFASSGAYRITKELSPDHVDNRWSVARRPSTSTIESEAKHASNDSIGFIFVPQLLMYLFLGISVAIASLCLYLLERGASRVARRTDPNRVGVN